MLDEILDSEGGVVRGGADRESKGQVMVSRVDATPPGARRQAWKCLHQGTEVTKLEREAQPAGRPEEGTGLPGAARGASKTRRTN